VPIVADANQSHEAYIVLRSPGSNTSRKLIKNAGAKVAVRDTVGSDSKYH
jgi:hypothetical protein